MNTIQCERCGHQLCAKKVSIFSELSDNDIREIIKLTGHKVYKKGDIVCHEGDSSNFLYILNEGKIKLTKMTKDGKEQIVRLLANGDFFGELSLFTKNEINNVSAYAISTVKICTLSKESMKMVLKNNPEIAMKLLGTISSRLAKMENLVQNLATNDAEVRAATIILELSYKFGKKIGNNIHIKLPLNREELANYAGVTRETMSRKLKYLKKLGLIDLVGTKEIVIKDIETLKEYAE